MSWFSKLTGHHWSSVRKTLISASNYVGAAALYIGSIWVPPLALAGSAVLAAQSGYDSVDAKRQSKKAVEKAANEAEAAARKGSLADVAEAEATEDTAGDEAYKRKQKALAGATAGRGGTMNISSNLGGSSSLG